MRKKIENIEKININMSERMKRELCHDAELFEAFFNSEKKLIMNRFLSCLIKGYYELYKGDCDKLIDSVRTILTPYMDSQAAKEASIEISRKLEHRHKSYGDDSDNVRLSYKATCETDDFITDIRNNGHNPKISTELRNMFSSYLSMPMYEREKIIFSEKTEKLTEYIKNRTPIRFTSSTAPNNKQFHAIPYALAHGTDEMFNYLLCQCYDEDERCNKAATFRLCRLGYPYKDEDPPAKIISKEVKDHLEKMKRCGPQYAINDDTISVIQLTPMGISNYAASYHGRPNYLKIEKVDEEHFNYSFENSTRQLFFYFRRFSAKEAVIISPEKLKQDMKEFHDASWNAHSN